MGREFNATDTLNLTNLKKVFWPAEGYTKGDLLNYYKDIAEVIVPYLVGRPQSLHRHPDGWQGKAFFQRISKGQPEWVETASVAVSERGGKTGEREFVICKNWPTLLWMVNFGCIEIIPWNSRLESLERPDYLVVDLDPQDVPMPKVVETAQVVHKLLDRLGAASHCKTSGKRGLHIFVPLGAQYDFPQAKLFGEIVARMVHRQLPATTSLTPIKSQRQGLIYLDYTRNSRGQSMAAAYCVRPWRGATVSTPLKWSEVRKDLDPGKYTIKTLRKRLDKHGDLWQPVLGPGIDLTHSLEKLKKLSGEG